MNAKSTLALVAICSVLASVSCQQNANNNGASFGWQSIPGGQTTAGVIAASSDALSRYFAPDGPIQPALTAIGGAPLRVTEQLNNGITALSSSLDHGAQRMSRSGGNNNNGNIEMPGMQALESHMPASFASLGNQMRGAIKSKNNFIRGQAERAINAGDRLREKMSSGLKGMQVRSSGHMVGMSNSISQAGEELKQQVQNHLSGTMSRMQNLQGIGSGVGEQARNLGRTLSNGAQRQVASLQQTGQELREQLKSGHQKNSQEMSKIMDSLSGSMRQMSQNGQGNLSKLMSRAQNALQAPIEMIQNIGSQLGSALSKPMGGGGGHMPGMGGMGGRY